MVTYDDIRKAISSYLSWRHSAPQTSTARRRMTYYAKVRARESSIETMIKDYQPVIGRYHDQINDLREQGGPELAIDILLRVQKERMGLDARRRAPASVSLSTHESKALAQLSAECPTGKELKAKIDDLLKPYIESGIVPPTRVKV